jgi:MerR family transcriptional regulator, heat shock protein HspR
MGEEVTMGLDQLDDEDFPSYTVGQASEVLHVQPAFLRSLDAAGVISPGRSHGGHRRYSRRQLTLAARVQELFSQGHSMASAKQLLALEDDLRQVQLERDHAHRQRDQAYQQRDQAYQQRDEAREERDHAREHTQQLSGA